MADREPVQFMQVGSDVVILPRLGSVVGCTVKTHLELVNLVVDWGGQQVHYYIS